MIESLTEPPYKSMDFVNHLLDHHGFGTSSVINRSHGVSVNRVWINHNQMKTRLIRGQYIILTQWPHVLHSSTSVEAKNILGFNLWKHLNTHKHFCQINPHKYATIGIYLIKILPFLEAEYRIQHSLSVYIAFPYLWLRSGCQMWLENCGARKRNSRTIK